jgi:vitamin B12 transporter
MTMGAPRPGSGAGTFAGGCSTTTDLDIDFEKPRSREWDRGFFFVCEMKRIALLVLSFLTVSRAQVSGPTADSVAVGNGRAREFSLPGIVVSATRWGIDANHLPSSATVLSTVDLETVGGTTLASALEGVPNLFIKPYGGPGAVATTSIRGMGAEHTLVLIDGQRINNVRDGQVDFGTFLLSGIDRVEILRGGYSSIYGSDALGGVINIVTKRPDGQERITAEASAGSYGMNGQALGVAFGLGEVGLRLAARREGGNGDYEFRFHNGGGSTLLRRSDADYSVNQLEAFADYSPTDNVKVGLTNIFGSSNRGSPGAVLSPSGSSRARLLDHDLLSQLSVDWTIDPSLLVRFGSSYDYEARTYSDPGLGSAGAALESRYNSGTWLLTPQLRYVIAPAAKLTLGAEVGHSIIRSNEVHDAVRDQRSVFLSTEHLFDLPRVFPYQLNLFTSLRYDGFSDVPGAFSPRVGLNIGLLRSPNIHLRSSFGRSFHAPTFDDLYWKTGGNPDLHPERSTSFDAGLLFTLDLFGPLDFELNYFDIDTRDRIVWTPRADGLWSPKNLQRVESAGLEYILGWRLLASHLVLHASYTNSQAKKVSGDGPNDATADKQLIYLPLESASVAATLGLDRWSLSVKHSFTGFRFVTETNDPHFILPSFQKTDLSLLCTIFSGTLSVRTKLEVLNFFNSDYQVFPGFPMPLRTYAMNLMLEY